MAYTFRRRSHQPSRAPPPTPIATGKGHRSAAVDDVDLTEYLENSLKVPDLILPESISPPSRISRHGIPAVVELQSLVSRDEESVGRLLASAVDFGAFRIDGHDVSGEDVRSVMELAGGLFRIAGEKKRKPGRYFGRRDGVRDEFRWFRPVTSEAEAALKEIWPDTYPTFREKLENTCTKLERIAESIGEILLLSEHARRSRPQHDQSVAEKKDSVLCMRKYDFHGFGGSSSSDPDEFDEATKDYYLNSHALSLHLLGDNREFCIQYREGSVPVSVPFSVPTGSVVVTLGERFQEWCDGEFKSVVGEPIFELTSDPNPSFSLEFMCSPSALNRKLNHATRTISLIDQLLIALALVFLHKLWAYMS